MSQLLKKRVQKNIPLTLTFASPDGTEQVFNFLLSWTFRTAAMVEEITGINLITRIGEIWTTKLSSHTLGVMLWASLLHNHPEYGGRLVGESVEEFDKIKRERQSEGLETVLDYIDIGNFETVMNAVWNVFFENLPEEQKRKLNEDRNKLIEAHKDLQKEASPLAEMPESPSDGSTSGPSLSTTSESATTNSSISPTLNSTLSLTDTLSASGAPCSVPAQSPPLSPTVLHSATPIGSL